MAREAAVKVAALQFKPDKAGPWDASARRLLALAEEAAAQGAELIVAPEMALSGYIFPDARAAAAVAEPAQGRTLARFAPLCEKAGCTLVIGYPEAAPAPDRLYNSALIIGPGGLIGNYRKRLLYELDYAWATPGDTPYPLVDTGPGTLSAGICMDLNDDRFTAFLRRRQPDLVAFCTNWIHQGLDIRPYWLDRLAGFRGTFIAANTYGPEEDTRFLGFSAILHGRATLALGPEEGDAVLVAEVPSCAGPRNGRK